MIFAASPAPAPARREKTYYTRSNQRRRRLVDPCVIKNHNVVSFHGQREDSGAEPARHQPVRLDPTSTTQAAPTTATVCVVHGSASTGTMAASDVYVSRSIDNGATWGAGVKVNDDSTSTAQFHPFLTVDQTNGNVIVGWHDARNDTTNNRKVDYYMSRSVDRGVTFEANTKVSQPARTSSAIPRFVQR